MKSSARYRSYFALLAILAVSSCTVGCISTLFSAGVAINNAIETSKAEDAIVAQKTREEQDIKSTMVLHTIPNIFKRHQVSSTSYWCAPQTVERGKQRCNRGDCCARITMEEAPYIVFKGNKISLETEESFIKRHRYLDLEKLTLEDTEDTSLSSDDRYTQDVYTDIDAANQNFPNRNSKTRDSYWNDILDTAFPNQKQHLAELNEWIASFYDHPVAAWVENILPLYQQCKNSTNCMEETISKYLATPIKAVAVSKEYNSEFAYQFQTRSDWCYLVFEQIQEGSNTHLVDTMTSSSLTTFSPYDDIQKFRAKAEYTNLDSIDQKFHVEGICSVLPTTAARKRDGFLNGSTPIILGWPRAQMPQAIAMMAEVELHELKQDNVCPVIDRSAEFTWNYNFYGNYEISVQRIPQQVKSNVKTYDMNCSHPYALIDYFKHPVPGTLVWNKNNAYIIADKTAHFKSYTVLRQDGDILNGDPQNLSTQNTSSGIQYYNSVDSKCSCLSIDPALPEKYQACGSQKDPFTCCDNLLRTDMQTERENLQNQYNQADEATKASIQSRLSLLLNDNYIQRQIYARCGLDNTKAYDNIEKLFRLEDSYTQSDYPSTSAKSEFSLTDLSEHFNITKTW